MKTIAELKRMIKKDVILKIVKSAHEHKFMNVERKVNIVQTNAFTLIDENGNNSWLYYPKSSEFRGTEKGFIILDPNGKLWLEYEIINN